MIIELDPIAQRLSVAWSQAAPCLLIAVFAPAYIYDAATRVAAPCFLPHFGGPRGMLVCVDQPPDSVARRHLVSAAKSLSLYWTLVNPGVYSQYSDETFKEALADWGYFGPEDRRPEWLIPL